MSDIEREEFERAVTDRCSRSKTMSEEIKIRLVGAMRQFRHNFDNSTSLFNPEEGFVCAYDREVTNRIVEDLTERNRELEARVAELVSGLEGIAMCAFDYSPKSQSATQAAEWMNEEAERLMASQNSEAFIKRKQAEAVQASRQAASVPEGWRSTIEKAINMASVFDDGGDGAKGVVSLLTRLLASPTKADERE